MATQLQDGQVLCSTKEWLVALEHAAEQLAEGCRAARAAQQNDDCQQAGLQAAATAATAPTAATSSSAAQAQLLQQSGADLRHLISHIQELLQGCADIDSLAPDTTRRCTALSSDALCTSPLLALPHDLLSTITELAGSKEVRRVCRQLKAAFSRAPRTVLRQAPTAYEVDCVEAKHGGAFYGMSVEWSYLRELRSLVGKRLPLGRDLQPWGLQHCILRWPGQFTRLELPTDSSVTLQMLQAIHDALPSLRELKCTWLDPDLGCGDVDDEDDIAEMLPSFTDLHALTAVCSVSHVLQHSLDTVDKGTPYALLAVAPNLRELHADMRFIGTPGFDYWVSSHTQLTHVTLCFDESAASDIVQQGMLLYAVQRLALCPLQSVVLRSPATWLGERGCDALQKMTSLTSLHWSYEEIQDLEPSCIPRWLGLPNLRLLVLSSEADGTLWTSVGHLSLPGLIESFGVNVGVVGGQPALESLCLPVVVITDLWEVDLDALHAAAEQVRSLLAAVQHSCPNLTSLRCGRSFGFRSFNTGPELHSAQVLQAVKRDWLGPVGGLRSLQRLAVTLDTGEVHLLACLARLKALTGLWLQFMPGSHTGYYPGTGLLPAEVVSPLTGLRTLAVCLDDGIIEQVTSDLSSSFLEAAQALPCLELLDTHNMLLPKACSVRDAAAAGPALAPSWQQLALYPPARLRRLVLRWSSTMIAESCMADMAAELRQHLPSGVEVVLCVDKVGDDQVLWPMGHFWVRFSDYTGPAPWSKPAM